jgi:hypothetical protein
MQCLLFAIGDEAAFARMTTEAQQQLFAAFGEYGKALNEAGVLIGSYRPQPMANAKTVRVVDGEAEIKDGLHSPTDEPIAGVYVLDVPDLDAALIWAERNPAARLGVVEVRPI